MALVAEPLSLEDALYLLDAIHKLSRQHELAGVTFVIRQAARKLIGSDGITFVLREADKVYYADEDAIGPLWKGQRFPAEKCISGWSMIHRESVIIEDIYQDVRIPHDAYRPTFVKSLAIVPIRERDPLGAIGSYWSRHHRADARQLRLMQALADAASLALLNIDLVADLQMSLEREKAARTEVETERARLLALLDELPADINFLRGPELVFEFAHTLTRRAFGGCSLEDQPLGDVLTGTEHKYSLDQLTHVYRTGQPCQGQQVFRGVARRRTPAGAPAGANSTIEDEYWSYLYLPTRNAAGYIDGVMTFSIDITDQVRALRAAETARAHMQATEERLRIALEASALGTWDYNLISGELMLDWRCKQLFGIPPYAAVSFELVLAAIHPDDRAGTHAAVQHALTSTSGGTYDREYRTVGIIDNVERWVRTTGQGFFDSSGRCVRFIGTVQDIGERKHAEQERAELLMREQHAREHAERASRTKDEFLAMLGHELRNPLAPIVTALQLFELRGEHKTREHQIIRRQVTHLVSLVDDLLDVSRITRGTVALKKERAELATLITKAIEIASPLIEQRCHHLAVDVPRTGLMVDADPVRIAQVIANLLTNAAKYTQDGGHIQLSAEHTGGLVNIHVRDDGQGISKELLPHVFNLFVQGARTTDRRDGGLGIGLTLVKSLVELHGGTVAAHSAGPGQGTEIIVGLPAAAPAAAARPSCPSKSSAGPAQPAPRGGAEQTSQGCTQLVGGAAPAARRVLVVDDNIDAAEMMAETLRAFGHHVMVAYDGPKALALLSQETPPDVAILDIGLPVMDGYELARNIASLLGPRVPQLIAVTGYGQPCDRNRSAQAGFRHHLVKPVDVQEVIELVAQAPSIEAG